MKYEGQYVNEKYIHFSRERIHPLSSIGITSSMRSTYENFQAFFKIWEVPKFVLPGTFILAQSDYMYFKFTWTKECVS